MTHIATKRVDEVGRIVLPRSLRKKHGLEAETYVDVFVDDSGQVVLQRATSCCVICGGADDLKTLRGDRDFVCIHCRTKIKEIGG